MVAQSIVEMRQTLSVALWHRGMFIFPVQLTTSSIGNLTRLIHTLLYVMTIHTYQQMVFDGMSSAELLYKRTMRGLFTENSNCEGFFSVEGSVVKY